METKIDIKHINSRRWDLIQIALSHLQKQSENNHIDLNKLEIKEDGEFLIFQTDKVK